MTAPASDLVKVTLVASPAGVQLPSFSKLLFLATHKYFTDRVRTYGKTSDMTTDGFQSTDPAYIAATEYFSQTPPPDKIKIGRRSVDAWTVTVVTATDGHSYTVTVDGVDYTVVYSDVSPTVNEVATALRALTIPGITLSGSGAAVIFTALTDVAHSFTFNDAKMTLTAYVASATAAHDLDAIANIDPDFYGVASQDRDSTSQQAIVTWAAANTRVAFVQSQEANVIGVASGSDSSTLPAIEKLASQDRSFCVYGAAANAAFPDVALAGRLFALPPGGSVAFLKDLTGITVDTLTPTQRKNAHDKNCNVYELQGDGLPGLTQGVAASGKFIDQVIGRDWFTAIMSIKVLTALRSQPKLPFDDGGITMVENAMRAAVDLAVVNGYIQKGSAVFSMPKASSVSAGDKAARTLTGVVLSYTESGAIQGVTMQISVSV